MCCRYALQKLETDTVFGSKIEVDVPNGFAPRYNVAISDPMPVILKTEKRLRIQLLPFGIPARAGVNGSRSQPLANARIETLFEKPTFREAADTRRCLIPADGYYEWEKSGRDRLPHYFQLRDSQPFYFAGLWQWGGKTAETSGFVIVTTQANTLLRRIHERMPVILGPNSSQAWLGDSPLAPGMLARFARPLAAERMKTHRVSTKVNHVRYQHPDCIAPLPITPGNTSSLPGLISSPR
jgi:putative SOS response-associated peptidase YedK